jgi:hypothetical protein
MPQSKSYKSASTFSAKKTRRNRPEGLRRRKNFGIPESMSPYKKMHNRNVRLGDTITVDSNNQMGHKKYKVIDTENGKKGLQLINSYEMENNRLELDYGNSPDRDSSYENSPDRDSSYKNSPDRTRSGGKNYRKKHRTRRHKK